MDAENLNVIFAAGYSLCHAGLAVIIIAVAFFGWRQQRVERASDQVVVNSVNGRLESATTTPASTEQTAVNKEAVTNRTRLLVILPQRGQKRGKSTANFSPFCTR